MDGLRISQLAERTGVPATTLRFYENEGLLPAARTPAGYRVYGEAAVERLGFIGAAKRLGLSLEEIAELLEVWADGSCAEVRAELRPRLAARVVAAERHATEAAALATALRRASHRLDGLPDRPGPCDSACGCTDEPTPIACSLPGAEMEDRLTQWRTLLSGAAPEVTPTSLRFTLPADRAAPIAALAVAEHQCCPFLDFHLTLSSDTIRLEITAPTEATDLLAAFLT